MPVDKLKPSDPRATHHTATIHGHTYHYRLAVPPEGRKPTGTVILIHGFPDLGFGWRNQIPFLAEQLGLQVIVPDLLGYGQTDAPDAIEPYAHKNICRDLTALVDHVGVVGDDESAEGNHFFVGGHDWGGAVAWRMGLWYGERVRGIFSVCTPYQPPPTAPVAVPLEVVVEVLPNFRYQLQFAADELWQTAEGDASRIRGFLNSLYGGRTADGTRPFTTEKGVDLEHLKAGDIGPSPLLSQEEIDYYVQEYARHGLRGPTNWYRLTQLNFDTERELVARNPAGKIEVPSLMVVATADIALPMWMSEKMGQYFTSLKKETVEGSHWVLWQSGEEVNKKIEAFLGPLVGSKASI